MAKRYTLFDFVDKARAVHGDLDDYSDVDYVNSQTKVKLRCIEHDHTYMIKPNNHIGGKQRCPRCASEAQSRRYIMTESKRGAEIDALFPNHFDWRNIGDGNKTDTITIRCKKHDVVCTTTLSYLSSDKMPCPVCAKEKHTSITDSHKISWQQFLADADTSKYSYELDGKFDLSTSVLKITCNNPDHPSFTQTARDHRNGSGCKRCAWNCVGDTRRGSLQDMIDTASAHFPSGLMDYSKSVYVTNNRPISIRCTKHDLVFMQRPDHHKNGYYGCPRCASGTSRGEVQLHTFIEGLGEHAVLREKIAGREYDIVVHNKKIAIEFCGNYWHSELQGKTRKYHLDKMIHANKHGYRLLTIFEDEWVYKSAIVESRITNILGQSVRGYGARKLKIKPIDYADARDFLNLHHIQGATKQMSIRFGAYYDDTMVAVMTFNHGRVALGSKSTVMELVRFATDGRNHAGIAGKLLAHFRRTHMGELISYADLRWSDGGLYGALGFEQEHRSPPNYWYMNRSNYLIRKHRFGYRKAVVVAKYDETSAKTEWEIMQDHNHDRIWDCGNIKFRLAE